MPENGKQRQPLSVAVAAMPSPKSRRTGSHDHHPAAELATPAAAAIPAKAYSLQGSAMSRHRAGTRDAPLGLGALVVLVYFGVSGGPFGVEGAVGAAGPLLTLLGFVVLPFVWAIPEALVTTELSTAFPEAAGYVAWVEEAFGSHAGFMEGYMSWLSGVTDNSIYPALFLEYLIEAADGRLDGFSEGPARLAVIVGLTLTLVYLNYRGLELVGNVAIGICLFALAPFVVMVLIGVWEVDPHRWTELPDGGWDAVRWGPYLNVLFWNLNYWDSASSFAGEVTDPGRTFPKAMCMAVMLVVPTYMLPLLIGIGASRDQWSEWRDGHFSKIGAVVGGPWLQYWIALAAGVSNVGMFEAELSSDALQLSGMAERRMLPAVFAKRSRHGTPTWSLAASAVCLCFLGTMSFTEIVEVLNFLYCFAELLEFGAFIWLRVRKPVDALPGADNFIPRLFKVPLGTAGCALMLMPASILILVVISSATTKTWVVGGCAIVVGVLIRVLSARSGVEATPLVRPTLHYGTTDAGDGSTILSMSQATVIGPKRMRSPMARPHSVADGHPGLFTLE